MARTSSVPRSAATDVGVGVGEGVAVGLGVGNEVVVGVGVASTPPRGQSEADRH